MPIELSYFVIPSIVTIAWIVLVIAYRDNNQAERETEIIDHRTDPVDFYRPPKPAPAIQIERTKRPMRYDPIVSVSGRENFTACSYGSAETARARRDREKMEKDVLQARNVLDTVKPIIDRLQAEKEILSGDLSLYGMDSVKGEKAAKRLYTVDKRILDLTQLLTKATYTIENQ